MKVTYLAIILSVLSVTTQAQKISSVLQDIERNNLELRAVRSDNQASFFEIKSQNSLESPSVEYSPFFKNGVSGIASSELVVSQDFDFPTLYAARRKSGKLQQNALDLEYMTFRRNILQAAQQKCLDLVLLNRMRNVLKERMDNADELLILFEKKFEEGDASGIELNKIRMEQMDLQTGMLQNESSRQKIVQELLVLNGNQPLSLDSISYPEVEAGEALSGLRNEIMESDAGIHAAEASVTASAQEIRVTKQGWLPKLAVGYRRNTERVESSNGFLIGASFPIFSNSNKVKAAKSKQVAAQLYLDNTRMQVASEADSQIHELQRLNQALRIYDLTLMKQSLELLKKAVVAGNMSLIDYYMEADKVYLKWQTYLSVENQYQSLWATLHKNRL